MPRLSKKKKEEWEFFLNDKIVCVIVKCAENVQRIASRVFTRLFVAVPHFVHGNVNEYALSTAMVMWRSGGRFFLLGKFQMFFSNTQDIRINREEKSCADVETTGEETIQ